MKNTFRSPEGSSSNEELNAIESSTSNDTTLVQLTTSDNVNSRSEQSSSDYIDAELNRSRETGQGSDEMKRALAKELIEKYFYQLSDGCGNPNCTNKNCASSGELKDLTPNQAAAKAIQLFSEEAPLCDVPTKKIARSGSSSSPFPQSSSTSVSNLVPESSNLDIFSEYKNGRANSELRTEEKSNDRFK